MPSALAEHLAHNLKLQVKLFRAFLTKANFGKTADWTFLATVLSSYVLLSSSYFAFGGHPPWTRDIPWLQQYQNPAIILYALEMATLTLVVITAGVLRANESMRGAGNSRMVDATVCAIFCLTTFTYACLRISEAKDFAPPRLLYAAFSTILLSVWFRNATLMIRPLSASFFRINSLLQNAPQEIFVSGRRLASIMTTISLATIVIIAPLFFWMPTLLSGLFSPQALGFLLGVLVAGVMICSPLYTHSVVTRALNRSFENLDKFIATEILKPPNTKDEADKIKTFVDLREAMSKSVNVSTNDVVAVVAQNVAILAALATIAFGKK